MTSFQIFQRQTGHNHTLQSLLVALSFTPPLQAVYVQSIVLGFVKNVQDYVSNQKVRGWLVKRDGLILLSEQAQSFVRLCSFTTSQSKHEISKQTYHDLLLVRTLFLCLLHLNFEDIIEIRKQKYYDTRFIPDITIVTKNLTLSIEIDRGKQPAKTLETKIRGLLASNSKVAIIYFTDAEKIHNYFSQNFEPFEAQCIYLKSPTLAQDLLNLTAASSTENSEADFDTPNSSAFPNPAPEAGQDFYSSLSDARDIPKFQPVERASSILLAHNVFVHDPLLVNKMLEPLSNEFVDTLHNLEAKHLNNNSQDNYEDTLTDTLRLLEQDGFAEMEGDVDE